MNTRTQIDEYMDLVNESYFVDRPAMNEETFEMSLQTIAVLYGIICGLRAKKRHPND